MTVKHVALPFAGNVLEFYFPSCFNDEAIIEGIKAIRLGSGNHWSREFRDLTVIVTEQADVVINGGNDFKYIVMADKKDPSAQKYMVVFPKSINHDFMFEAAQRIVFQTDFDKHPPRNCVSAGFISYGKCGGKSESLGIASHKDDSLKLV